MHYERSTRVIKRLRVRFNDLPCYLGHFATMVGQHGGSFGELKTVHLGKGYKIRNVDITLPGEKSFDQVCEAIRGMDGVDLIEVKDVVQETHVGGKIEVVSRVPVDTVSDLQIVYTPGVASICRQIHADPELARRYTGIHNTVAIVTNGTAILGLGDIGPVAGMPVMEGKALLFRRLAGISGYPVLVDSKDPDVVVATVRAIASTFGAVKLEDIAAPACFEIEARLDEALPIPVMHDDQHGTAVVVLAALLNIARATFLDLAHSPVGIVGLGAAGQGIMNLLTAFGVEAIYGADINEAMNRRFAGAGGKVTDLAGIMEKSRFVIATTGVPGLIKPEMVRKGQVILALSNPDPEIDPDLAVASGAAYAADGKSVNNALAFPGIFRGALDARATRINNAMRLAAARAIAGLAAPGDLVPGILDPRVHEAVAREVAQAALRTGVVSYERDVGR